MKSLWKNLILLFAVYAVLTAALLLAADRLGKTSSKARNVAVNKINTEITIAVRDDIPPEEYIAGRLPEWKNAYSRDKLVSAEFVPIDSDGSFLAVSERENVVCSLRGKNGTLLGVVKYTFKSRNIDKHFMLLIVAAEVIGFIISAVICIWLYIGMIKPFRTLSEYPERLARLQITEKLPETKRRYFGKYIWGMNMLCDVLESDRKRISRLEADRQTMLASLAHGVKTPVANIRLYSQAMKMGMYKNSEQILEAADKIESNAVKLEKLTVEMIETASTSVSGFEPEIEQFYLKELADMIETEFSNRLSVKKIPCTIDISLNTLITSDKWAIFRVISQLLENAIKYGDGGGITVSMFRENDDICISVKNKGSLLPESELPYVFKSYWRGSNASDMEGSGIGLFTAREVLKVLGGSIYARRLEETSEMEFVICLEGCSE